MHYEPDKILECFNTALHAFGFQNATKIKTEKPLSPVDKKKLTSEEINEKLTTLKLNRAGPLGIHILAEYDNKSINCVSDENAEIMTLTASGEGIGRKILSILAVMADLVDEKHKDSIATDYNILSNSEWAPVSHVPFYKLMGLNGSGFRIFDIYNQNHLNTPECRSEITIAISSFPILFLSNHASISLKKFFEKDTLHNNEKRNPDYLKPKISIFNDQKPFQIFINNFTPYSPKKDDQKKRTDFALRISIGITQADPKFCSVFAIGKNGVELYYVPSSITNSGSHFNILGRADPIKATDFLFLSRSHDHLPKELKIEPENFKKLDITKEQLLNNAMELYFFQHKDPKKYLDIIADLNTQLGLDNFFSASTRIRLFKAGNHHIFYAKNPTNNGRKYKPAQNPLPPFPSSDYVDVKNFLNKNFSHMGRQKQKNPNDDEHAVKLKLFAGKRTHVNLGQQVKNNLAPHWSGTGTKAADMVTKAFSDADAKRFYSNYLDACSPFHPTQKQTYSSGEVVEVTAPRAAQEWCHLIAHKDSNGDNNASNLVAGSFHANTEQCAIESAIRASSHYNKIKLKITAYLVPCEPQYKPLSNLPNAPQKYVEIKNLINKIHSNQNEAKLTPAWLYELITHGTPLKKETSTIQKKFIQTLLATLCPLEEISTHIEDMHEYYGLSNTCLELGGSSRKKLLLHRPLRNALRHLYDELSHQYYSSPPVAAFIRYRIFVDRLQKVNYVVDAMRDEFDINEYRLTRWFISACLNNDTSEITHDIDYDFESGAESENHEDLQAGKDTSAMSSFDSRENKKEKEKEREAEYTSDRGRSKQTKSSVSRNRLLDKNTSPPRSKKGRERDRGSINPPRRGTFK
jgi:hypothetical protein